MIQKNFLFTFVCNFRGGGGFFQRGCRWFPSRPVFDHEMCGSVLRRVEWLRLDGVGFLVWPFRLFATRKSARGSSGLTSFDLNFLTPRTGKNDFFYLHQRPMTLYSFPDWEGIGVEIITPCPSTSTKRVTVVKSVDSVRGRVPRVSDMG